MIGNINPNAWSQVDPSRDVSTRTGTNYLSSDYSDEAVLKTVINGGLEHDSFSEGELWYVDFTVGFSNRNAQNYTITVAADEGGGSFSNTIRQIPWRDTGSGGHTYHGNVLLSWEMVADSSNQDGIIHVGHRDTGNDATNVVFSAQSVRLREASNVEAQRYTENSNAETFDGGNPGFAQGTE